jgi:hypothetical protein
VIGLRDQLALAQECLEVEYRRESVIDYLRGKGFISPAATWQRLQLNYLDREPNKLTKGNGDIMAHKITLEQKKKAVQIAINGGSPIDYLGMCGSKNPVNLWSTIKASLKQADPELYAKIPDQRKNGAKKRNEDKEEAGVQHEPEPVREILMARTPIDDTVHIAAQKVTKPVNYDGLDVCGVRGKFGTYTASIISGKHWIDFDDPSGDTLSYPVEDWKDFLEELRKAAAVLGVTL